MRRTRLLLCPLLFFSLALPAADTLPSDILARTRYQVGNFLKVFSEVRCTEVVSQAKLTKKGKVEHTEKSTFDYLVIAQEVGSELSLQESRLEQHAAASKKNVPLLVTNGFATLLLVFHPSYENSFQFTKPEPDTFDGQPVVKIGFRHIQNKPSTMELVLRGREYPLDLTGNAWVDPVSGQHRPDRGGTVAEHGRHWTARVAHRCAIRTGFPARRGCHAALAFDGDRRG